MIKLTTVQIREIELYIDSYEFSFGINDVIDEYEKYKKPVADAWGSLDENFKFVSLYEDNFKTVLNLICL